MENKKKNKRKMLIYGVYSFQIDYPEVHSGRMHRPPQPHPISDHRQVNLVFEDSVSKIVYTIYFHFSYNQELQNYHQEK